MILAPRSSRFIGQILDGFVGVFPLICSALLVALSRAVGGVLMIASLGWMIFYYFLADGLNDGQSIAKRWLRMRVVSADTGAPCTFMQSFVRNLLLAVLGPIDWIFIFGERHQRLGDKAAGTIVISE